MHSCRRPSPCLAPRRLDASLRNAYGGAVIALRPCLVPMLLAAACRTQPPADADHETAAMPTLHVALQDGFQGETLVVEVNDREVYRRADLRTDQRIGLADSFDLPLGRGKLELEASIPDGPGAALTLDFDTDVHVAVSLVEGELRFRVSDRPFGYL